MVLPSGRVPTSPRMLLSRFGWISCGLTRNLNWIRIESQFQLEGLILDTGIILSIGLELRLSFILRA